MFGRETLLKQETWDNTVCFSKEKDARDDEDIPVNPPIHEKLKQSSHKRDKTLYENRF